MAWAAAIPAAASIIGDLMSQQGAQGANAQQIAANEEMQQRAFQFDQGMFNQETAYDTQMSNTAMQRRVADLQAAGLNPLLAVSAGGASAPTAPGTTGPGGSAGSLQNPGASFGRLGDQTASAIATGQQQSVTQAQVANLQAQAASNQADADTKNARLPYAARGAAQDLANAQETQSQIHFQANRLAQDWSINMNNYPYQLRQLENTTNFQQALQQIELAQQALDLQLTKAGLPAASNTAAFHNSLWGHMIDAITGGSGMQGISSLIGAGASAARAAAAF